jgi:serine/threonine kinase PknH
VQRLAAYGEPVEGTPFGRYRLVELLGRGGMGEVWRAHDTVTDRVVAIKVLPAHLSEDEDFQRRFRREAHAAARLETPHVVPIYDYGEIDGRLFVSMRLIKGRDLDTVLADGALEPARAVRIIEQVAEALHAAHEVGLLHRDIKPSNILLGRNDFAYLIDFGIARALDETRMTKSGNTIGTFAYIAPERLDPRIEEDARADIYSLACVLYEALTGQPPFAGTTTAHLMFAHVNTPPPRPSSTQPNVPAQFDAVIAKGMAKGPDQRYATTVELANAAHDAITTPLAPPSAPTLLADQTRPAPAPAAQQQPTDLKLDTTKPGAADRPPVETPTPPQQRWWPPRGRSGLIAAIIVAVVVLVSGVIIFQLQHPSRPAPPSTPTTQAAPAPPPPPPLPKPVEEAALQGLLLSPDQINTAMGASGMTVNDTPTTMGDNIANVADAACRPLGGPLEASVYAGSGWTAFREQVLREPGNQWTRSADQGVVLFSSAHDAEAFFTASAQSWPACSNRQYTFTQAGKPDMVWSVGPVSNANGMLSYTSTLEHVNTWNWQPCQRALTVANNVVIDVETCDRNQADAQSAAGVNVAHQIAAKVPT